MKEPHQRMRRDTSKPIGMMKVRKKRRAFPPNRLSLINQLNLVIRRLR